MPGTSVDFDLFLENEYDLTANAQTIWYGAECADVVDTLEPVGRLIRDLVPHHPL